MNPSIKFLLVILILILFILSSTGSYLFGFNKGKNSYRLNHLGFQKISAIEANYENFLSVNTQIQQQVKGNLISQNEGVWNIKNGLKNLEITSDQSVKKLPVYYDYRQGKREKVSESEITLGSTINIILVTDLVSGKTFISSIFMVDK